MIAGKNGKEGWIRSESFGDWEHGRHNKKNTTQPDRNAGKGTNSASKQGEVGGEDDELGFWMDLSPDSENFFLEAEWLNYNASEFDRLLQSNHKRWLKNLATPGALNLVSSRDNHDVGCEGPGAIPAEGDVKEQATEGFTPTMYNPDVSIDKTTRWKYCGTEQKKWHGETPFLEQKFHHDRENGPGGRRTNGEGTNSGNRDNYPDGRALIYGDGGGALLRDKRSSLLDRDRRGGEGETGLRSPRRQNDRGSKRTPRSRRRNNGLLKGNPKSRASDWLGGGRQNERPKKSSTENPWRVPNHSTRTQTERVKQWPNQKQGLRTKTPQRQRDRPGKKVSQKPRGSGGSGRGTPREWAGNWPTK